MYVEQIVEEARDLLGDTKAPYLWTEREMLSYYKKVDDDFCRETLLYTDETTPAICYVYLTLGNSIFALSDLVLAINSAYLYKDKSPVYPADLQNLEQVSYDWRTATGTPHWIIPNIQKQSIRIYPYFSTAKDSHTITGSSDITFASTTIVDAGSGFLTAGFSDGCVVQVTGTSLNNTNFIISDAAAGTLTTTGGTVEANTSAVISEIEILVMNVSRLSDNSLLTVDTWDTTSPSVPGRWHSRYTQGIMAYAYGKRDSETYDPKERDRCEAKWREIIEDAKRDTILISDTGTAWSPNPGAL